MFERFYVYFVPDYKHSNAVLGVDFISCCKFSCNISEDIFITGFDTVRYDNPILHNVKGTDNTVNFLDVSELIALPIDNINQVTQEDNLKMKQMDSFSDIKINNSIR